MAVDVILLGIQDEKLKVLLINPHTFLHDNMRVNNRCEKPQKGAGIKLEEGDLMGRWALPGGFVQIDESLEDTAKRILMQKAGIRDIYLEQLYTFGDLGRDARGRIVSTAYYALVDTQKLRKLKKKTHETSWFNARDLPSLAYDHSRIIKKAINRLEIKIQYTNVSANLLPKEFTFSELQNVYEIILGKKLDKRNLRKRILSLNLIEPSAKKMAGGAHRPARLYRFINKKIVYLDNPAVHRYR